MTVISPKSEAAAESVAPQRLLSLYREMVRIRRIEEKIADYYAEQEMRCPVHLCIGQEAVAVGACAAVELRDYVLSGHRSHGHFLAKGGDLKAMMAELYGKAAGCAGGKGGSMHLIDLDAGFLGASPIVGSTVPIAVGTSFASKMRGEERVTMLFFGESVIETGVLHESVNFAVLHRLPVVFVCENNLFSVYSPLSVRQPAERETHAAAAGHGIPARKGDGNDVVEVSVLGEEAVARARRGDGPSFLEFTTYRWREHCGPNYDNDIGYREPAEFAAWKKLCPVARAEATLIAAGAIDAEGVKALVAECDAEIESAIAYAKDCPFPASETTTQHLWAPEDFEGPLP